MMPLHIGVRFIVGRSSRPTTVMALLLGLVSTLLAVGLVPSPGNAELQALPAPSTRYYLSSTTVDGAGALASCAAGFHMASMWEISDPSNLKYDARRGMVADDSGSGPPTGSGALGWVRTGYPSSTSLPAGQANCGAWTLGTGQGTSAYLTDNWTAGSQNLGIWVTTGTSCASTVTRVWCASHPEVFLPIAIRE